MKNASNKNSAILDIGCSGGNMMLHLIKKGFQKVSGIEMNDYAVESCVKKDLNVIKMDVDNLELPGSYDIIYLNHVLEHIVDPCKFIRKAKSYLKKDSFIIIGVPNIGGSGTAKKDWIGYQFEQHFWYFTPLSLKKIFTESGFNPVNEIILTGGRFKSSLYSLLRIEGDSLISVFKSND
jgi:2-polyprenyl-3-methyl-5-hydroxy-6-metoxy-1,4-benzoquinol methylase